MYLQQERKYRKELPQPDDIAFDEPFDLEHKAKASGSLVERSDGKIQLMLCMSDPMNVRSSFTVSFIVEKDSQIEDCQRFDPRPTQSHACGSPIEASVSYALGNETRVVWGLHVDSQQWFQNPVAFELLAYTDGSVDWLPKRRK